MYEIELYESDDELRDVIELDYDFSTIDQEDPKQFSSMADILDYVNLNHKFRCKRFVIKTHFGNPAGDVVYDLSSNYVSYHRWGSMPSGPIHEEDALIELVESLADAMHLKINGPLMRSYSMTSFHVN